MQTSELKGADTQIAKQIQEFGLSERQANFLLHFMLGMSKSEAAAAAGYAPTYATILYRSAKVQQAMAAVMDRFLVGELAPSALRQAHLIMNDEKAPHGVRANLALGILDRAGFDAKRHQRLAESGKDVSQMSADELQASIDKIQAEIDGRMRDITPYSVPDDTQDIDLYP